MNLQLEAQPKIKIDLSVAAKRHTQSDGEQLKRYDPPALTLDGQGLIQECGKSVESIFGYSQHELIWQHISCLFPKLSDVSLLQGGRLNPMLSFICHCDHDFEAISKQSDIIKCNLNFFLITNEGIPTLRLIVRPSVIVKQ
jgi:hypothetical protein